LFVFFFVSHEIDCTGNPGAVERALRSLRAHLGVGQKRSRFERCETICRHCEKLLRGNRS
jgi:hypothetical protein